MKTDPLLKDVLERIERSSQDDFAQIVDVGPEYFSTATLLRLQGRCQEALQIFDQLHRLLLWLGVCSPGWILLSFPIGLAGNLRLAYFVMGLSPLTFFIFAIGSLLLKSKYNSRGYLEYIESSIATELKKRELDIHASGKRT
jgi:hypothetical protein